MPPVFAVIVQPLPKDGHYLCKLYSEIKHVNQDFRISPKRFFPRTVLKIDHQLTDNSWDYSMEIDIDHLHRICCISDLCHDGSCWSPWFVAGCLSNFALYVGVVVHCVFPDKIYFYMMLQILDLETLDQTTRTSKIL